MGTVAHTAWKGVEDDRGFYSHLQGHLPQSAPPVVTTLTSLPLAKYIPFSSPNQVSWQYSLETPRCSLWNQVQMHRKLLRSSSESEGKGKGQVICTLKPHVQRWNRDRVAATIVKAKVAQSCPTLCNPTVVARQAPLSMGLCRREYRSVLPCPLPGDHPYPGI